MAYTIIDDPTIYFNTVLYTGNGGTQSITSLDFQPDWCWFKDRSGTNNHALYDSVRGATKMVSSNNNNAESTNDGLTSFNSNGFTLGNVNKTNTGSTNYAAWNWKAGGSASSNSNGSITSSVSANTTAGFSIVSYTGNGSAGATVGHGLSAIPKFILVKVHTSSTAYDWRVFHASLGATKNLILNDTSAVATATNKWNDTEPTSSVFSLGNTAGTNESGSGIIAYCFAEKKGYSKFGSYTGGGSSFPFIYIGFKPAFIIFKRTNTTNDWFMVDNKINPFNVTDKMLRPNLSNAEQANNTVDLLSNGFKPRGALDGFNANGSTYIYMAFAESPFVSSSGVPTTAR